MMTETIHAGPRMETFGTFGSSYYSPECRRPPSLPSNKGLGLWLLVRHEPYLRLSSAGGGHWPDPGDALGPKQPVWRRDGCRCVSVLFPAGLAIWHSIHRNRQTEHVLPA